MYPALNFGRSSAAPVATALCAIAVGVAVYAFLRPQPAAFLPAGWHRPLSHGLPAGVMAGLPTFVHTLLMSLLTAALVGSCRANVLGATCAAWCVVEVVFEFAQHPAFGPSLGASLHWVFAGVGTFIAFENFVRAGTIDVLDIAASVFASLLAYAILTRRSGVRDGSTEVNHA